MYFSFSWFSLFSPYFSSYSVHFSFFTFFSDFVIFPVVMWLFLIFNDFQFSCHIPCPTVDISKLSNFFRIPRHISRPKVCISHFPWFSLFSPYFRSYSVLFSFFTFCSDFVIFHVVCVCFSFSMIFSFLAIFHVVQWTFLNFPPFFSFPFHISHPKVCISHLPWFSVLLPYSRSYSVHFSFFTFFSDFVFF